MLFFRILRMSYNQPFTLTNLRTEGDSTYSADAEHHWCERLARMVRMVYIHVKNLLQSKWKLLLTCYIVADRIRMMSDNKQRYCILVPIIIRCSSL